MITGLHLDRRLFVGRRAPSIVALLLLVITAGCGMVANSQNSQGVRLYQQGYYPQAIQKFQQATTSDPKDPDGYYNLAATYHRLGKLNNRKEDTLQAESLYNQCLDRDPNHRDCYRGLAVLLAEQQRTDEAQRLLQGWSTRYPTQAAPEGRTGPPGRRAGRQADGQEQSGRSFGDRSL